MGYISVADLDFSYAGRAVLHGVSFELPQGSVTALVGPNGAGKTTLMRCMASLEAVRAGGLEIAGIDVVEDPRAVRRRVGYLSDFFGLYDDLTVRQCLAHMGRAQGVVEADLHARIEALATDVDIAPYIDRKAGDLSRGYRQRLGVALALIHDPEIVLLDEPASGMDPEARVEFSALIKRLAAQGRTLVVSSHILAELEDYCDGMLVLRDGRLKGHVVLDDEARAAGRSLKDAYMDLAAVDAGENSEGEGA